MFFLSSSFSGNRNELHHKKSAFRAYMDREHFGIVNQGPCCHCMTKQILGTILCYLNISTHLANSADDKSIFFLFFPENRI